MFEFLLDNHKRYIYYHDGEGYEVDISDYSNHKVLVPDCGCEERNEKRQCFIDLSSSQGVVDVSHEEAVDREVPFPPVLREVACIPPVIVEPPICKLGQLSPEVHVRVEK